MFLSFPLIFPLGVYFELVDKMMKINELYAIINYIQGYDSV